MSAPNPLEVEFSTSIEEGELVVEYSAKNTTPSTIIVFDRLRDREWDKLTQGDPEEERRRPFGLLDRNWAYVHFRIEDEVVGQQYIAVIKRGMEIMNRSRLHPYEVPYGREVAPGQTFSDRIRLSLPLKENELYAMYLASPEQYTPIHIGEVELELGWMPRPEGEPGYWLFQPARVPLKPYTVGSETILPFYSSFYWMIEGLGQLSTSARRSVSWDGLAYVREKPGER